MKRAVAALFSWSLRVDAASVTPHVIRGGFALFVLMSVGPAAVDAFSAAGPGLHFFRSICTLNVMLITVSGVSYFVSAVSEEKDAGTLALLKLAGAPPLGIILSKSTSRFISALMLLLIQLPFTFLATTLGGVTWYQVLAAYAALAGWLGLVANAALFCSVSAPTSGRAAVRAIGLLLGLFVLGPILTALSGLTLPVWVPVSFRSLVTALSKLQQTLMVSNRLNEILSPSGVTSLMGPQFWVSLLVSSTLFVASVLQFNRLAHPTPPGLTRRTRRTRRLTAGRAWKLAVTWKDFLFFTGGFPAMFGRCLMYLGIVVGFLVFHLFDSGLSKRWLSEGLALTCFLTVLGVLTIEILLYAAGLLTHEVEQKTVAPLALVPLDTVRLLAQKSAACLIAIVPGLIVLLLLVLLFHEAIEPLLLPGAVILYLFNVLLCSHLTVLCSLYSRWAALPAAVFLTLIFNGCFPTIVLGVITAVVGMARVNGLQIAPIAVTLINIGWAWMFVLLPLEIEIVRAWKRKTETS